MSKKYNTEENLNILRKIHNDQEPFFSTNDLEFQNNFTSEQSEQDGNIHTESISSTSADLVNKILHNANQQGRIVEDQKRLGRTLQTVIKVGDIKEGGRQLDYNNYKREAHVNVSDYINNRLSKYEKKD